MLELFQSPFALAGLVAATGPLVIHLLNRRRYKVVQWAAMDFLREALQRSQRILHLRDLILLLLRTACLLFFGWALAAGPHGVLQTGQAGRIGAVHAVLVVDNSQSMGYTRLDGTLLDEARRKGEEFLDQLPPGSRISVLPLCGSEGAYSLDPYRSKDDAREALQRISVVDRMGSAVQAADLALAACKLAPDIPAKRVVFLGDQQAGSWPNSGIAEQFEKLPEAQVVRLGPEVDAENAWVADFHLQDGIADVESTTAFYATIRFSGPTPVSNVQVTLEVDGSAVASRNIDLEPGQSRELQFPYRFEVTPEPGRATFVPATISLQADTIPGDRLLADNQRHLVVPVVAALPVVFVDQLGDKENAARNEYGETFRLRRMLVPMTSRGDQTRQLVTIRHTTIDGLTRQMLEDARLVVIAGVPQPGSAVTLLREYLLQGGQVLIATGGLFDPKAWTEEGWLNGTGILPAPLVSELYGQTPQESRGALSPFQLVPNSMVHQYFRLEDVADEELADLYQVPLFFKTASVDLRPEILNELRTNEIKRLTEERDFLVGANQRLVEASRQEAQGKVDPQVQAAKDADAKRRAEILPQWLLWSESARSAEVVEKTPEQIADQELPQVLARFSADNRPALVERRIGRGTALFFASAVSSDWNDLTKTNAALIFDRILRIRLQNTLPQRNLEGVDQLTLPVEALDRRVNYTLLRPGSEVPEALNVDALGGDRYGVSVRNITRSGIYRVSASRMKDPAAALSAQPAEQDKLWEVPLAVNGPESEAQLESIDPVELRKRLGNVNFRWVERDEAISLEGAGVSLQHLWFWLLSVAFLGLLVEMLILAWPTIRGARR